MTRPHCYASKLACEALWAGIYYRRFVYLATLEDILTRQVVGWEVSTRHNADLVARALLNALNNYQLLKSPIQTRVRNIAARHALIFFKSLIFNPQ